jgi:hypothetical protein
MGKNMIDTPFSLVLSGGGALGIGLFDALTKGIA